MTNTTDRELLELAAKAAGLPYIKPLPEYDGSLGLEVGSDNPMRCRTWNPLNDDGDALRLGVRLGLTVVVESDMVFCRNRRSDRAFCERSKDQYAATRRAIVRAAAAIGDAS